MKRITIIGGGASGTLLTVNLLRHAGETPVEINLIEYRSKVGRGVAFGTDQPSHLLNVPAGKMGGFPDDIEHFHKWLTANGHNYDSHAFVPRKLFADYLRDLLREASENKPETVSLNIIDDEAVSIRIDNDEAKIGLRFGETVISGQVILAFGNFAPPHPSVPDLSFTSAEKYFQDPWSNRLYETIKPTDSIFVIGTGLSMIDVAMHYHQHGHQGQFTAISTRGLLPALHELGHTYPAFSDELFPAKRITDVFKVVRQHFATAEATGSNWRAVIDSLRPATQRIWLELPLAEKRYFMQHLSRYWNVARHRVPPEAGVMLEAMTESGKLDVLRGRLKSIVFEEGRFNVKYMHGGAEHTVTADALVNCIGSQSDFSKIDSDLLKDMLVSGLLRTDALPFGINATPDGALIGADGQESDILFTLGPALKGILWESTAIPEIRTQAKQLALKLLAN